QSVVLVVEHGSVVAARELEVGAGIVEPDIELAGGGVDRLRRELELPERADGSRAGRATGEYARAVLLLVAEAHLEVPVAEKILLEAEPDIVAPGLEVEETARRRRGRDGQVGRADPAHGCRSRERLETRGPGILDEIAPVSLARVIEAQLPVVESD